MKTHIGLWWLSDSIRVLRSYLHKNVHSVQISQGKVWVGNWQPETDILGDENGFTPKF